MDLNGFMYLKSNEYVQVKIDNHLISSITLDHLIKERDDCQSHLRARDSNHLIKEWDVCQSY